MFERGCICIAAQQHQGSVHAETEEKTLPKDFEQLVLAGEIEEIKAVFNVCELNARGGTFKQTALAFNELPNDVTRWPVEQGADLSAPDSYGETPLHARSRHWQGNIDILLELGANVDAVDNRGDTPLHKAASVGHARNVERLLDRGAQRDACNNAGLTPLEHALLKCTNPKIPQILAVAKVILSPDKTSPKGSLRSLHASLAQGENSQRAYRLAHRISYVGSEKTSSFIAQPSILKESKRQALH